MLAEQRHDFVAVGQVRECLVESIQERRDFGAEHPVRERDTVQRRVVREGQPLGRGAVGHRARGDLGEVVVLGLEPEQRHAPRARLGGEHSRDRHRGGGLVERVQRPQEQAHLLACRDHDSPWLGQGLEVCVPLRARGESRVLDTDFGKQRRIHSAGPRCGDPRPTVGSFSEPLREERVRAHPSRDIQRVE